MIKIKKNRPLRWILGILIAFDLMVIGCLWFMFGTFITAARSIEKLEDGLYTMEYNGDYGLDEFLEQGGAADDEALADYLVGYLSKGFYKIDSKVKTGDIGCSTLCLPNENGDILYGRNFDWEEGNVMLIHTRPKNGYESTATCLLDFLGFGDDYVPDSSMTARMQALAAIYVPLDGMNEKGLMVSDLMAGDDEVTHQQTEKPDLTTTTAIRLLLDRAATVEEALELLSQYDMNSSIGSAHHLSIADASGRSIVVEYVNGEMLVKDTKVVTNHYLCDSEKQENGSEQSHIRFDRLQGVTGVNDESDMMAAMKSVAQMNFPQDDPESYEKTLWTIVYNPAGLCADLCISENYDHTYGILLHEKGSYVKR